MDKKDIQSILALTPMQEGILFHYLKNRENTYYFEQLSIEIWGEINTKYFKKAWHYTVQVNEALRTAFRWEKLDKPVQVVLSQNIPEIRFYDLSTIESRLEQLKQFEEIKRKDRDSKFDLQKVPFRILLCKFSNNKSHIVISNHHILYDGWSTGIILKEFFQNYKNLEEKKPALKRTAKPSFGEFIRWQKKSDPQAQKKFWEAYLKGYNQTTSFPFERNRKKQNHKKYTNTKKFLFTLEHGLKKRLELFLKDKKITLATALYCICGLLLQKYYDTDDIVLGNTVSGRSAPITHIENMVGLFINTLPLRIISHTDETITDLFLKVNRSLISRENYENTPLTDIIRYIDGNNSQEIFDTLVVIENYPLEHFLHGNNKKLPFNIHSYSAVESTNYNLNIIIAIQNNIEVRLIYNENIFTGEMISRISLHFNRIINEILTNPNLPLHRLDILPEDEKKQLLVDFNKTDEVPVSIREKKIYELLEEQVERNPGSTALVGLKSNGEISSSNQKGIAIQTSESYGGGYSLTYGELNKKSDKLSGTLIKRGIKTDEIVAIKIEPSLEMIIGILGILKAGGAYLPVEPDYPRDRIAYILADSKAKILLTKKEIDNFSSQQPFPPNPRKTSYYNHNPKRKKRFTSLAYIIYTSGSTGHPKGVMVNHRSVFNLLMVLHHKYPLKNRDTYLLKTNYLFDVSVTELFGWYIEGGRLAIMEKGGEKEPRKILDTIEKIGITHINFTPSMFNIFLEALTPTKAKRISSLKYIFLAGEALLPHLVDKFRSLKNIDTAVQLENLYGPTEGTIYASGYSVGYWEGTGTIPIGKPLTDMVLLVLDRRNRLQPIGISGELSIGGIGVARGYLNRPVLTWEKFCRWRPDGSFSENRPMNPGNHTTYPHSTTQPLVHLTIYRTGDSVRWQSDGNIEFLGRIDSQVKIRGFRIEPGEIEHRLMSHDKVKEALVIPKKTKSGEEFLCAYIVPAVTIESNLLADRLKKYLAGFLPEYMIPPFFVPIEHMPRNYSGKLDRKGLPDLEIKSLGKYISPRNEKEKVLVKIWAEVLEIEENKIGINDNFFQLGGHSLKVAGLVGRIHKKMEIAVPFDIVFQAPTIKSLAQYINKKEKCRYWEIFPVEEREYYPLSSPQKRIYTLQQMIPESTVYNVSGVMELTGAVNLQKIEAVFQRLMDRHESLRTFFQLVEEKVLQKIHPHVKFKIDYIDLPTRNPNQKVLASEKQGDILKNKIENYIRPFDLSQAPLLRVCLLPVSSTLTTGHSVLIVDMHHIVSDGTSLKILLNEFAALYKGEKLPNLKLQYKDYAQWQNNIKKKRSYLSQKEYWEKEFKGEIPALDLPTNHKRPAGLSFQGKSIKFELDEEITDGIKRLATETETTLFMLLITIYSIFLSKICSQEEIIIGYPLAGRKHDNLEKITGMLVNTLVLRSFPSKEKNFLAFLGEVRNKIIKAFENQDYPYEELVEQFVSDRDTSRNPLFDTMFALESTPIEVLEIPGLQVVLNDNVNETAKFDLTLTGVVLDEKLTFTLEFPTELFESQTIDRFIRYFKRLIEETIENRYKTLNQLEIISKEEKNRIINIFNNTEAELLKDRTILELIEEQAQKNPGKIALIGPGVKRLNRNSIQVSYFELNERAAQSAYSLIAKKIEPETVIGIMMKRSIELIIDILGILKSGAIYLPVNYDNPQERIEYILKESGAKYLISKSADRTSESSGTQQEYFSYKTENSMSVERDPLSTPSILDDRRSNNGETAKIKFPLPRINPSNPAYIIYTSGSTGRPKGVIVEHFSLLNLCSWHNNYFRITPVDNATQYAGSDFDASIWEIFPYLIKGAALHIIEENIKLDVKKLGQYYIRNHITISFLPTQFCQLFIEEWRALPGLRALLTGGDKLNRVVKTAYPLVNNYGPTENTVVTTSCLVQPNEEIIPIGKPITNVRVYILNHDNIHLQPTGLPGEICISGCSLSRGYLNQPELTAGKFCLRQARGSFYKNRPLHPRKNFLLTHSTIYRTGDLARWLLDGNIEYLGRIDQQVKLRGFRIELGEIVNQLLKYEGILNATVIAKERRDGDKSLVTYFTADKKISVKKLEEYLSKKLPAYMIPLYFIQLERIPITSNGKIDLKSLPTPEGKSLPGYKPPRNAIEAKLVEIWSGLLEIEKKKIGIEDNFFSLGGHSLKATILAAKIQKAFNVRMVLTEIFNRATIKEISQYIRKTRIEKYKQIDPVEKKEFYILSSTQKRLYIIQQRNSSSTAYNITLLIELEGKVNTDTLKQIFRKLLERHESFRTSFKMVNGELVQRIHKKVEFEIESFQIPPVKEKNQEPGIFEKNIEPFIRPFDLNQAPLLRVGIVNNFKQKNTLIVDMHHIICDGMSMITLVKDFSALYLENSLTPLRIQYKDYTLWQEEKKKDELYIRQAKYWQEKFREDIPQVEMPLDFIRPGIESFEGSSIDFSINTEESYQLIELAEKEGVSLYILLLSFFNVFISQITNQEAVVIGTAVAARRHDDLQEIIGMFVNTLALINYPKRPKQFTQFLKEVSWETLEAIENQDYPFEELVENIKINKTLGRNPLVDVMFAMQNFDINEKELLKLGLKPYEYKSPTSKFDLTVTAYKSQEKIHFTLAYSTKLFKKETIGRFIGCFKKIISTLIKEPGTRIGEIDIISERERNQILFAFNSTKKDYPPSDSVIQIFDKQVKKNPDVISLVFNGSYITYNRLNINANQLAQILKGKGVKPCAAVSIMAEPGFDMIIGIMAILKTGGAYLPIDPNCPTVRLNYMLEDSNSSLLLTHKKLPPQYDPPCQRLDLNDKTYLQNKNESFESEDIKSNHLAYIIFTSGSSGKPKGVLIEHRSLINLCNWHNHRYSVTFSDRTFKFANFGFDASVWEIFPYLLAGASIYILKENIKSNIHRLNTFFEKHGITIGFLPTQMCEQFMEISNRSLRILLTGGDKLKRFVKKEYQLVNNYGPTENTVVSTSFNVNRFHTNIPIGPPITNNHIYILNQNNKLQPIGIPGELVVSGVQLGRGYLNKPELTNEKFNIFIKDISRINYNSFNKPSLLKTKGPKSIERTYRTGDLAKWLADGSIEFLGRIDAQLKIRGFRIETGDIERCLLSYDGIKEAVVIAKEDHRREKYLCAYMVTSSKVSTSRLRNFLSIRIPNYMIPPYFVEIDKIPLTTRGKINPSALPEPEITSLAVQGRPPRDELEEKLAILWADILGIEKDMIGIDSDFFALGGHSLKATALMANIQKEFNVNIPLEIMFKKPFIQDLAAHLKKAKREKYFSIKSTEKKEYYPLSSAQGRLYVQQQMDRQGIGYNIPSIWHIEGEIDTNKLRKALYKVLRRHESLRTSFAIIKGKPVQLIHDEIKFEIERNNPAIQMEYRQETNHEKEGKEKSLENILPTLDIKTYEKEIKAFIRPFELSSAPLLRVGILDGPGRQSPINSILMVDMHHIISDGLSANTILKNIITFYRGENLPPLKIQYKDYSEWENTIQPEKTLPDQENYWMQKFKGPIPALNLPTDYPRPTVKNIEGKVLLAGNIDNSQLVKLRELAREKSTTLNTVLLAIFYIFLYKYTNQEDIVVGITAAGRPHYDLEPIIGMFVNMLPLRNFPSYKKTFNDFLDEVKICSIKALENQNFQFDRLVEKLKLKRDASRNPLFDTVFVFQNFDELSRQDQLLESLEFKIKPYMLDYNTAKYDLLLSAAETEDGINLFFNYCGYLFKEETVEAMGRHLKNIITGVLRNPAARIAEINLVSEEEALYLLKKLKQKNQPTLRNNNDIKSGGDINGTVNFNF